MRNLSIDRARTFLTLVVLLHHAVIPYTHFGHSDPTSWIGFDMIVLATDSFFMAMFFFLSGLFVWKGLERKSARQYLQDRFLRLGLPFVICALTLMPFTYYTGALVMNPELSFTDYWWKTVTKGPWASGPIWFLWVLLAFDLLACLIYRISPKLVVPISREPVRFWFFLLAVTLIAYIPLLIFFGPSRWFEFGPLSMQASRVLLYASYFFIGAGTGYSNAQTGLLSENGSLPKKLWFWSVATLTAYALLWTMIYIKRAILGNPPVQPWWYHLIYGTFFVLFSASILCAILAFFLRSKTSKPIFLDRMQGEAYGMFLVHYPIVGWIQYFLLDANLPAIAKALLAFVLSVALSWAATLALKKIPGAKRVL